MSYLYYPGCSLKCSGRAYEESLLPVFEALGAKLEEVSDWNCCGATSYMSVNEDAAFALALRNLCLAEEQAGGNGTPVDVVAPCAACFLVLERVCRAERFPDRTSARLVHRRLPALRIR